MDVGCCTVIDDPDLAEVAQAHEHLIEIRVVGNCVEVCPVRVGAPSRDNVVVDVNALGMRSNVAVVLVQVEEPDVGGLGRHGVVGRP